MTQPPQPDKPTLRDVVNGTPKGQQAVDKALKRSAKHQAEVSRQAQTEQKIDEILTEWQDKERAWRKANEGLINRLKAPMAHPDYQGTAKAQLLALVREANLQLLDMLEVEMSKCPDCPKDEPPTIHLLKARAELKKDQG